MKTDCLPFGLFCKSFLMSLGCWGLCACSDDPLPQWNYTLQVKSPDVAAYAAVETGNYEVVSYRTLPENGQQEPVAWEIIGFDANGDNIFGMEERPDWLKSLTLEKGAGGKTAETGKAVIVGSAALVDVNDFRNNKLKSEPPRGQAGAPYDLAKHDIKGHEMSLNTANCYVISAPGLYKLPLVYGNALTDGKENPKSYTSSAEGNYILTNFVDHAGQPITSPYIALSNEGANVPKGAKIVWADERNLVKDLLIQGEGKDAYLQFSVASEQIRQGNVVVAVTNEKGEVLWSWLLWFAPDDVLETTAVTNHKNVVYNFAAEALGWKYTRYEGTPYARREVRVMVGQTAGKGERQTAVLTFAQAGFRQGEGTSALYQWGRKDAFPGTDDIAEGAFEQNAGDKMSLANSISHPEKFYAWGSSWYNGCNAANYWSAENTKSDFLDDPIVKTVYDPSPAGFHVPASNAFTAFTTTGTPAMTREAINAVGEWTAGWHFKADKGHTTFFPATGLRYRYDGKLYYTGQAGAYWSAIPFMTFGALSLYLDKASVLPVGCPNRSYGYAVRPVRD